MNVKPFTLTFHTSQEHIQIVFFHFKHLTDYSWADHATFIQLPNWTKPKFEKKKKDEKYARNSISITKMMLIKYYTVRVNCKWTLVHPCISKMFQRLICWHTRSKWTLPPKLRIKIGIPGYTSLSDITKVSVHVFLVIRQLCNVAVTETLLLLQEYHLP